MKLKHDILAPGIAFAGMKTAVNNQLYKPSQIAVHPTSVGPYPNNRPVKPQEMQASSAYLRSNREGQGKSRMQQLPEDRYVIPQVIYTRPALETAVYAGRRTQETP